MKKGFCLGCATLLLSSCIGTSPSDVPLPKLDLPITWQQPLNTAQVPEGKYKAWWQNFNDACLSSLIEQMLAENRDLALAGFRLQQAQLAAGLVATNLTPDPALTGSASSNKHLDNGVQKNSYNASFGLSYEIDLWGKLARAREQAVWQVEASEQDRAQTALLLIGHTAQNYWRLASLNQQRLIQQQSIELSKQTLQLVQVRVKAGASSELELVQAEAALRERQERLISLKQQQEAIKNALALLLGQAAHFSLPTPQPLDINQEVPVAAQQPLSVIASRPDVQAAERRLRAALAGAQVARLSFYPTLSLSASLGAGAAAFSQWFSDPVGGLGANSALPFLAWNRVRLTIAQSDLSVKQAEVVFRNTAYQALAEVDDALAQRLSYQQQKTILQQKWQLSQRRLALSRVQYQAGAISLQNLLEAQDAKLNAQRALIELQYNYLNATMKLWLAFGGGMKN